MTKVVNLREEPYHVYIGRANEPERGYFGNPFSIGHDGSREEVIARYKSWFYMRLKLDSEFKQRVELLRGKVLGCFCKPLPCHGDVIAEYLDGPKPDQRAVT